MNNEFVSYEIALKLKELGFDEPCMYAWCVTVKHRVEYDGEISLRTDGNPSGIYYKGKNFNEKYDSNKNKIQCSAPLYQQVFRWFREQFNWQSSIEATNDQHSHKLGYNHFIWNNITGEEYHTMPKDSPFGDWCFKTYEEAQIACILDLISIIKNQKK